MKKIIAFIIVFAVALSLCTISVFAEDSEQETDSDGGFLKFFGFLGDLFSSPNNMVKSNGEFEVTLREGGYNYASDNINRIISASYNILYPIGLVTMLLGWAFGIGKATITSAIDIKDKHSIIRSLISFVIGIAALMLAPQILTVLTQISRSLCNYISDVLGMRSFFTSNKFGLIGVSNEVLYGTIVLLIIDLVLMLNLLWIALLQCLSPLFVALLGGDNTKKIAMNFIKEYFIALLIPPVTIIYFWLCMTMIGDAGILGLIGGIVLGISTLGIASKKLPRLIN